MESPCKEEYFYGRHDRGFYNIFTPFMSLLQPRDPYYTYVSQDCHSSQYKPIHCRSEHSQEAFLLLAAAIGIRSERLGSDLSYYMCTCVRPSKATGITLTAWPITNTYI